MATTKVKRFVHNKQSLRNRVAHRKAAGQLRRLIEFPQTKGKVAEKIELYTAPDYHSITIDFEDQTSLNFEIEPGFTINAELQQRRKGETHVLAEWPPIQSRARAD